MDIYKGYIGRTLDDGTEEIHYPITDSSCVKYGDNETLDFTMDEVRRRLDYLETMFSSMKTSLEKIYDTVVSNTSLISEHEQRLDGIVIPTTLPANGGNSDTAKSLYIQANASVEPNMYHPIMSIKFNELGNGFSNITAVIDNNENPPFSYMFNLSLYGTGSDYFIDFSQLNGTSLAKEFASELILAYNDKDFYIFYKSNLAREITLHTICNHIVGGEVEFYRNSSSSPSIDYKAKVHLAVV